MQDETTAVLYRVSSDDQTHDSQVAAVERWLRAHGLDPARVRVYRETETGRRIDREGLTLLRRDIAAGRVRTVVVYKLDRLSRDLLGGLTVLADWIERGVRVASATEEIDLSGPVGRMIAAVLLGLAEIEWSHRRERQRDGIEAARRRGVYLGRRAGSTKKPPARVCELRAKGLSASEIAQALGIGRATVYRYLSYRMPEVFEPDPDRPLPP